MSTEVNALNSTIKQETKPTCSAKSNGVNIGANHERESGTGKTTHFLNIKTNNMR